MPTADQSEPKSLQLDKYPHALFVSVPVSLLRCMYIKTHLNLNKNKRKRIENSYHILEPFIKSLREG